jgi:hypothetical protein
VRTLLPIVSHELGHGVDDKFAFRALAEPRVAFG